MWWSDARRLVLASVALTHCGGSAPGGGRPLAPPQPEAKVGTGMAEAPRPAAPPEQPRGPVCPPTSLTVEALPKEPISAEIPAVEDDGHHGLSNFHEVLAGLSRRPESQLVRIVFYGDSNLTLDQISGTVRRRLQARFGDGGHGFVGIGSPWRGYRHQNVKRRMVGHWETYIFTRGAKPRVGGFGAAGMSAASGERGAKVKLGTADPKSPVGRTASKLVVFYHRHEKGGRFRIHVDDKVASEVDTRAKVEGVAAHTEAMADTGHRIVIENLDRKFVHLLGAVLERASGIVVDTFAVTGATYGGIAKLEEAGARRMLAERSHDLVLFMLGTNFWNSKENLSGLDALLARHRAVNPKVSVLVLGPPDHVRTKTSTASDPRVVRVVEDLRAAAKQRRIAFWDVRAAMGGDGSMRNFYYKGLAGKDLYHLTKKGADLVGQRLAHALLHSHSKYLREHPTAGCAPSPAKTSAAARGF